MDGDGGEVEFECVGDADLVVEGGSIGAFGDQAGDVDVFGHLVLADGVEAADFEELVDELVEAVEFGLHGGVELFPPFGVEVPHPEGLEIELQGRDGGFELVVTLSTKLAWRWLRRIS